MQALFHAQAKYVDPEGSSAIQKYLKTLTKG